MTIATEKKEKLKPYYITAKFTYDVSVFVDAHSKNDAEWRAHGLCGGPDTIFGNEKSYRGRDGHVDEEFDFQMDFVGRSDYPIIETVEEIEE